MKINNKTHNSGLQKMTNGSIKTYYALEEPIRSNTFISYKSYEPYSNGYLVASENGGELGSSASDISRQGICGSIQIAENNYLVIYTSGGYQNICANVVNLSNYYSGFTCDEITIDTSGTTNMSGMIGIKISDTKFFIAYTHCTEVDSVKTHNICYAFITYDGETLSLDNFVETNINANFVSFPRVMTLDNGHYLCMVKSITGDYIQSCMIATDSVNNTAEFTINSISGENSYGDTIGFDYAGNNRYIVVGGSSNYKLTLYILNVSDTYEVSVVSTNILVDTEYSGQRILVTSIPDEYGYYVYAVFCSGANTSYVSATQYLENYSLVLMEDTNEYDFMDISINQKYIEVSSPNTMIERLSNNELLFIDMDYIKIYTISYDEVTGVEIIHKSTVYTSVEYGGALKCLTGINTHYLGNGVDYISEIRFCLPIQEYITDATTCPIKVKDISFTGNGIIECHTNQEFSGITLSIATPTKPGRVCIFEQKIIPR